MTQKEIIDLKMILKIIIDLESPSEEVANSAINFSRDVLKRYPKIKETVDDLFCDVDTESIEFNHQWDDKINWLKWKKEFLK